MAAIVSVIVVLTGFTSCIVHPEEVKLSAPRSYLSNSGAVGVIVLCTLDPVQVTRVELYASGVISVLNVVLSYPVFVTTLEYPLWSTFQREIAPDIVPDVGVPLKFTVTLKDPGTGREF